MRSFAEYRKNELRKSLPKLAAHQAVSECFDMFRLELLEAVKLPPLLFESSIFVDSAYEQARKEDYQDNKEILEFVISDYKSQFYSELFAEAQAAAADPTVDLRNQLTLKIKELVQKLRQTVTTILNSSRPPAGGSPSSPSPTTAPKSSQASGSSSAGSAPSGASAGSAAPTPSSTATPAQGASGFQPAPQGSIRPADGFAAGAKRVLGGQNAGRERPQLPNGFQPAPYGSIKPADGWRAGLKRAFVDPVANWMKKKSQNFRRRWHGDEFREHSQFLESLFVENLQDVMAAIDSFEKEFLTYLTQDFGKAAPAGSPTAPNSPASGGSASAPVAATSPVAPGVGQPSPPDLNVVGRGQPQPQHALATPPGAVADPANAGEIENPTDVSGDGDSAEDEPISALAIKGAEMLGITINGAKPNRKGELVAKATDYFADGAPLAKPSKSGSITWQPLSLEICRRIFDQIEKTDKNFIADRKKRVKDESGKRALKTSAPGFVRDTVYEWLGLPKSTSHKSLVPTLLAAFRNKMNRASFSQTNAVQQPTNSVTGTQQPAAPTTSQPAVATKPTATTQQATSSQTASPESPSVDGVLKQWTNDPNNIEYYNRWVAAKGEAGLKDAIGRSLAKNYSPDVIVKILNGYAKEKLAPISPTKPGSSAEADRGLPQNNPTVQQAKPATVTSPSSTAQQPEAPEVKADAQQEEVPQQGQEPAPTKSKIARAILDEMKQELGSEFSHLADHSTLSDEEIEDTLKDLEPNSWQDHEVYNRLSNLIQSKGQSEAEPAAAPEPAATSPADPAKTDVKTNRGKAATVVPPADTAKQTPDAQSPGSDEDGADVQTIGGMTPEAARSALEADSTWNAALADYLDALGKIVDDEEEVGRRGDELAARHVRELIGGKDIGKIAAGMRALADETKELAETDDEEEEAPEAPETPVAITEPPTEATPEEQPLADGPEKDLRSHAGFKQAYADYIKALEIGGYEGREKEMAEKAVNVLLKKMGRGEIDADKAAMAMDALTKTQERNNATREKESLYSTPNTGVGEKKALDDSFMQRVDRFRQLLRS